MKFLKFTLSMLFLVGLFAIAGQAQTNFVNEFSITFDRNNGYNSTVVLRGNNVDIVGRYSSAFAPYICSPCTQNQIIRFGGVFDTSEIGNASGYINGVFYPQLYFGAYTLSYNSPQEFRIPRVWSKRVRVSAPVTLTGRIGVWQRAQDVGNPANALFDQSNINLTGTGRLVLRCRAFS